MLVLPIKKKWFDMIKSGEKKEEYEEIIKKLKAQVSQTNNVIDLAYKEMEELDE